MVMECMLNKMRYLANGVESIGMNVWKVLFVNLWWGFLYVNDKKDGWK